MNKIPVVCKKCGLIMQMIEDEGFTVEVNSVVLLETCKSCLEQCKSCFYWKYKLTEPNPITKEDVQFGDCSFYIDTNQIYDEKDYCSNFVKKKSD